MKAVYAALLEGKAGRWERSRAEAAARITAGPRPATHTPSRHMMLANSSKRGFNSACR